MKKAALLLLLAGCSSSVAAPPPPQDPAAPPKDVVVEAENPEWKRIAEEAAKGRSPGEQQQLFESERRYQLALAWFNRGDFDKAKIEAQLAIQAWPEHLPARKLLTDVNEIIVGGPIVFAPGIPDTELRVARVKVEQQQIEITLHLVHGRRFLEAKMYESAIREFENAEFKIRSMPYDVKSLNDLLPQIKESIARAKSLNR